MGWGPTEVAYQKKVYICITIVNDIERTYFLATHHWHVILSNLVEMQIL